MDATLIVIDGRTSEEKLLELLAHGGECTELDFKETLDLTSKKDELSFIKDAISMHNHYPGGYLIIGACNDGSPSDKCSDIDWDQFDGRRLTDKVRKYVDAAPVITSQYHNIDGHEYCLICIMSLPDGLPIPFNKIGQIDGERPVFRRGDIYIRDGAGNDVIKHSQWGEILQQYERRIRDNERNQINTLISRISDALLEHGKTPPLFLGLMDDALFEALDKCFEANDIRKISIFVIKIKNALSSDKKAVASLAAIGSFAALYGDRQVFEQVIDVLYDYYCDIDPFEEESPHMRLEIATAIYVMGSAVVRAKRWDWVLPLVNKQGGLRTGYVYASWLRECQVNASRRKAFAENEMGMLISRASKLMSEHIFLCPDIVTQNEDEPENNTNTTSEAILNSLCGFDMLFCICVNAMGEGHGGAYPSCALFKDERVTPVIRVLLANDDKARKQLLPDCTNEDIANAFHVFWTQATQQSMCGNWLWGFDKTGLIQPYFDKYLDEESKDSSS